MADVSHALVQAAQDLSAAVNKLKFPAPVQHVYNPLDYAWVVHRAYLAAYGQSTKRVLFLGMNPGPYGMVQTGVPFGEIRAVRDWMRLQGRIDSPPSQHPRRPIQGFQCPRSEVSGQRLWGLFAARFRTPAAFFKHHFVANYCPLAFLEESGRNLTPDKLAPAQLAPLLHACDEHLQRVVSIVEPRYLIGVGAFAAKRAQKLFAHSTISIGSILHPSPASPAANRAWATTATGQLQELGVWE
jgi:single-strand selective monofunctional uracil DNA glycosylase